MKLEDIRNQFYAHTATASTLTRQLAFAGIALIWLFKAEHQGVYFLPKALLVPAVAIAVALALDFLQYAYLSLAWGLLHWYREQWRCVSESADESAPSWINIAGWCCFVLKCCAVIFAYCALATYTARAIRPNTENPMKSTVQQTQPTATSGADYRGSSLFAGRSDCNVTAMQILDSPAL